MTTFLLSRAESGVRPPEQEPRHRCDAPSNDASHGAGLRVVHQIPGRVRLRPGSVRWSADQRDRLAETLSRTRAVVAFRIAAHCDSVTVHHRGPSHAVIAAIAIALARPERCVLPVATPAKGIAARRRLNPSRRLLACAVAGLAIALLPDPVAPAMLILRFVVCALIAAVRHQARQQAQPCTVTRVLEAVAFLAGIVRAENIVRALVVALLKHFAQEQLQQAFS